MKTRAADCIINEMFVDSNDPEHHRNKYCKKNCCYKCLNGKDYKKKVQKTLGDDKV